MTFGSMIIEKNDGIIWEVQTEYFQIYQTMNTT